MPMREFECKDCGAIFDTLIRHNRDLEDATCPKCGSGDLEQCLTVPGNYTIKGNNSASTRPVKSRSNQ